jgi:hypothetical protein
MSTMDLGQSDVSQGRAAPATPAPAPGEGPVLQRTNPTGATPAPSGGVPPKKQKLVYILGTGRCGSTIFEILMGSHPNIQATGEFHGLPFPKWMPGTVCACGKTYNLCPFWSHVTEEYRNYVDFDQQLRSQERFEYYRCLPRTVTHRILGTKELRVHTRGMSDLIRVVAACSGKEVVTDSSKSAARGYMYALARSESFDVYFVHLVRDGQGYLYAKTALPDGAGYGKERVLFPPWVLSLHWVIPNLLGMLLCGRPRNRYLRIRYEDLVAHPAETLERVGRFIGVDMTPVIEKVKQGQPIPVSHLVGGNRLRFQPTITIQPQFAKQALTSREGRWSFWALGGWMALMYGYRPGGPARGGPGTTG